MDDLNKIAKLNEEIKETADCAGTCGTHILLVKECEKRGLPVSLEGYIR